jgi:hypothetical protein
MLVGTNKMIIVKRLRMTPTKRAKKTRTNVVYHP